MLVCVLLLLPLSGQCWSLVLSFPSVTHVGPCYCVSDTECRVLVCVAVSLTQSDKFGSVILCF